MTDGPRARLDINPADLQDGMAILALLRDRGPELLGNLIFDLRMPTGGALRLAAELEAAGLVTVRRPTGRNLSEVLELTPPGLRTLEGMHPGR